MAGLSKDLIDRIGDGIVDGEEPTALSKEVGLPLEEVLAVAHGLYGKTFPADRAFTARQSAYLRDCIKHGIPYEAMGRMLGVEVINLIQREPLPHPPSSNGYDQKPTDQERSTDLKGSSGSEHTQIESRQTSLQNGYDVSTEGKRSELYADIRSTSRFFSALSRLWDQGCFGIVLALVGEKNLDEKKRERSRVILYRLATNLRDKADKYESSLRNANLAEDLVDTVSQVEQIREIAEEHLEKLVVQL